MVTFSFHTSANSFILIDWYINFLKVNQKGFLFNLFVGFSDINYLNVPLRLLKKGYYRETFMFANKVCNRIATDILKT